MTPSRHPEIRDESTPRKWVVMHGDNISYLPVVREDPTIQIQKTPKSSPKCNITHFYKRGFVS
jgi:hypothetical protein